MTRILPVADGVLKHQLYVQVAAAQVIFGRPVNQNDAVMTFWSWKAGGSPVSADRISAEQSGIQTWVGNQLAPNIPDNCIAYEVRTWDYGLDPATRTVKRFTPEIPGLRGVTAADPAQSRVVALRSEPVGSAVRNRVNGRIFVPFSDRTLTQVKNVFESLRTTYLNPAFDADAGVWSIVSWYAGGALRTPPLVVPVNHCLCLRNGVQRRRNTHYPAYVRGA